MLRLCTLALISSSLFAVACTNNSTTTDTAALTDPEGGNVIFEYIYFDKALQTAFQLPSGVTTVNRVMAYFMDAQTPEDNPLPMAGQCNNFDATKGWPMYVGTPHTDLDVGTLTITGTNNMGSPVTISVPKQPMGTDAIGRKHDIYYQIINPNADSFVKPDSAFTMQFGGAGTIPATTFTGEIFMPQTFTLGTPGLENAPALVGGTDYPVSWNPATSDLPVGIDYAGGHGAPVLGITWLVDTNGSPTHMCPTTHSAGTFTIPGATINEYKQVATARGTDPTHAILLRNAIVHVLVRLPNGEASNKRRIDLLAVMCWAQLVSVQ